MRNYTSTCIFLFICASCEKDAKSRMRFSQVQKYSFALKGIDGCYFFIAKIVFLFFIGIFLYCDASFHKSSLEIICTKHNIILTSLDFNICNDIEFYSMQQ